MKKYFDVGCHYDSITEGWRYIFGDNFPAFDRVLALNETYVHLLELEKNSLIKKQKKEGIFLFSAN